MKMIKIKDLKLLTQKQDLNNFPNGKLLINTINAHSYNTALKDELYSLNDISP